MAGSLQASASSDLIIMLLSTDWFLPHWSVVGLSANEANKKVIQDVCRQTVRSFLEQKTNYFETDVSGNRMMRSVKHLLAQLGARRMPSEAIKELSALLCASEGDRVRLTNSWLEERVILRIVENEPSHSVALSPPLQKKLSAIWQSFSGTSSDYFGRIEHAATSAWDRSLVSRFSDVPTMLSDFLAAELIPGRKTKAFFGYVNTVLSTKEINEFSRFQRFVRDELADS